MAITQPTIHPRKDIPEFRRGGHEAICDTCGLEFWRHQRHWYTDDQHRDSFILMLVQTCDGRKWKL